MILSYLARICCFASKEVPIKKLSLLLGMTMIVGNLLNAFAGFCLIYFNLGSNLITFISVLLVVNISLFLILKKWLSEKFFLQIIQERNKITEKQNLKYQFLLLAYIVLAILTILVGVVVAFELR